MDDKSKSIRIIRRYDKSSKVEVTVQNGTSVLVAVDFTVEAIVLSSFDNWWSSVRTNYSQIQLDLLGESTTYKNKMGSFLARSLNIFFDGLELNDGVGSDKTRLISNEAQELVYESLYNTTTSTARITGQFYVECTSEESVTASVVVILTTIIFSDGKTVNAFDFANPKMLSNSGNLSDLKYSDVILKCTYL